MNNFRYHAPLDPNCPNNPTANIYDDPTSADCGCINEIVEMLENRHLKACKRCQEFGAANIEVID